MSSLSTVDYYVTERAAGVLLTLLGVASASLGLYVLACRNSFAAMAWPLGLCAFLELGGGAGMTFKAHRSLEGLESGLTLAPAAAELASQVENYGIARRVELGGIAVALVLCIVLPIDSTGFALALGLLLATSPLFAFDSFGLQRASTNLQRSCESRSMT